MSDIVNAFSPPFIYQLFDGRSIQFKRMLSRQWSALVSQLRAERQEKENIEINKQVGEKDHEQRQRARLIAQQYILENTTIQHVINWATRDMDGVDRLLKFSAVQAGLSEKEWDGDGETVGMVDLIPPMQKLTIAEEIAFLPIVPKSEPGGQVAGTAGQTPNPSPTGTTSAPPSSTSTDATPANTPSAS